jgi:glutathione S-transferase
MLKIWGRATSSNVQKATWALEELGLSYDRADVGGPFGGLDKPEFKAMNPNARIPVLEDDGFVLWESNVIVRYLAHKAKAEALWPSDPKARATADMWMDWQQTVMWMDFVVLIVGLVRTPADKRDTAAIEAARKRLIPVMTMLDAQLQKTPYLAGQSFTLGDIPAGVFAWRWFELPIERPALPALEAWYKRLQTRPAYKKIVMIPLA